RVVLGRRRLPAQRRRPAALQLAGVPAAGAGDDAARGGARRRRGAAARQRPAAPAPPAVRGARLRARQPRPLLPAAARRRPGLRGAGGAHAARVAGAARRARGAGVRAHAALLLGLVALGGCERGLPQMYDQPKYLPLAPSTLFADGNSSRPQVPGTVAHGAAAPAPPVSAALLARGRERFGIYCAPCHGAAG